MTIPIKNKDLDMCDLCIDASTYWGINGLIPSVEPHKCDIYAIICECPYNKHLKL